MIEKLERYDDSFDDCFDGIPFPTPRGSYVLYDAARAREDALLEALKDCMYELRDRSFIKKSALDVIAKIEGTR